MRPLFKIALTLFIGASFVVCYKIYERKKSRKPSRKIHRTPIKKRISDVKTLDETQREEKKEETKTKTNKRSVRESKSDILHPAPFDNVLGKIPSDKKTNKLCGNLSDSEMREIDQKNITFDNCEYIAAKNLPSLSSSFTGSSGSSRPADGVSTLSSTSTTESLISQPPRIVETFRMVEPDSDGERSSIKYVDFSAAPKQEDVKAEPVLVAPKENAPAPPKLEEVKSEPPSFDPLLTPTTQPTTPPPPPTQNEPTPVSTQQAQNVAPPVVSSEPSPPITTDSLLQSPTTQPDVQIFAPPPPPPQNEPSPSQNALTEPSSSGISSPAIRPIEKMEKSGSSDPLGSPKEQKISKSSTAKSSQKTKYKLCRCRYNNRNGVVEDKDAPKFNEKVRPEIAPTTVLPVVFSRYKPENLLEPHGDIVELPDECYKADPELSDNYLTPFHPITNATHAAHYHTCLITHLIENFDFFE